MFKHHFIKKVIENNKIKRHINKMSGTKCLDNYLNMIFVLGLLIATVVAVPTSVLVQNSEVTSNIKAANNGHNMMTKVKRSSNNANEMMPKVSSSEAETSSANKKSSPEVLPPAFNVPPASAQQSLNSNNNNMANGNKFNGNTNSDIQSMPSNEDIINSAIAAGLTAAAVEAAASAGQRDLEQQQQQQEQQQQQFKQHQQALLNGDEETPTLLHKRGISNQQYLYGGMGLGGAYGYGNANGKANGYSGSSGSGMENNMYPAGEYYYNNPYLNNPLAVGAGTTGGLSTLPNGVWADEMDPSVVYTDVQDDDYLNVPRASTYHNKAYDNLQNILNAEAYPESMALPLPQPQYTSRYYGAINGNKRSSNRFNGNNDGALNSNNRYADMRLKRDTKLTPADMLALVALVEAGERARKDTDTETNNGYAMYPTAGMNPVPEAYNNYNGIKTYYPTASNVYDYSANVDDLDENGGGVGGGSWLEPNMMDYYGLPMNVETAPKYELPREHNKYAGPLAGGNGNRYGLKRFMVAKKKRSMGTFLNEPVSKPSISYNLNGEKFY